MSSGAREDWAAVTIVDLARALIHSEDWESVAYIERNLGSDSLDSRRRRAIWSVLVEVQADTRSRLMLSVLASENRESIMLAPYRPGGVDWLVEIVLDTSAPIDPQVEACEVLGGHGDMAAADRIAHLANDATPYYGSAVVIDAGQETLGDYVTQSVGRIRTRFSR
jgi:hypothetical protein